MAAPLSVITLGHEHVMRPVSRIPEPDGSYTIHSVCGGGRAYAHLQPAPGVKPWHGCGLEQDVKFGLEGEAVGIRYRFAGVWFGPLDLIRLLPLDVQECPDCRGEQPLGPCERCGLLGVVREGAKIEPDAALTPR